MPSVEGPVPHDKGAYRFPFPTVPGIAGREELQKLGYTEQEFFFGIGSEPQKAYKTRMIVRRPTDARQFNGIVIVEWINVGAGRDAGGEWRS